MSGTPKHSHLSEDELIAQAMGEGSSKAQRISDCARCSSAVNEVSRVLASLRAEALRPAPDAWIAAALDRVRAMESTYETPSVLSEVKRHVREVQAQVRKVLQEIEAALVLDSHAGALLPGIRGNSTLAPRQLMFESSQGQVLLQVDTQGKKHDVRGQFLPSNGVIDSNALARLVIDGRETTVSISADGEFFFPQIRSGQATLRIELAEQVITLPTMTLPPAAEI